MERLARDEYVPHFLRRQGLHWSRDRLLGRVERDEYARLAGATVFSAPIGDWDVSSVTEMGSMFWGATSFNQRLGGQWATSTAEKTYMFDNGCPGSIEGKTNDADGTPM